MATLCLTCVALPSLEARTESEGGLWEDRTERCLSVNGLEQHGYSNLLPSTSDASDEQSSSTSPQVTRPCDASEHDASNNVCFEGAGAPASVRPELIARSKAIHTSKRITDVVRDIVGDETDLGWASQTSTDSTFDPPAPTSPDSKNKNSCTANPDTCRGLPPLPPELSAESSTPLRVRRSAPDGDERRIAPMDERPIPHRHRIGPSSGYQSPPDKPPK